MPFVKVNVKEEIAESDCRVKEESKRIMERQRKQNG